MSTRQRAYQFIASYRSPIVIILIICLVTGVPRNAFAGTWTAQSGAPTGNLTGIASSQNGQDIVVGTSNMNDVWLSTDYGVTWNEVLDQSEAGNETWTSFAMSADGSEIVGVQSGGYIWESFNGGVSWTEVDSNAESWSSVTMTADGENLAAVAGSNEVVVLSYDGGDTWLPADGAGGDPANPGSVHWYTASYSPSDQYLVLGGGLNGTAYTSVSTNEGSTWNLTGAGGFGNWFAVSVNDAGDVIEAGNSGGTGHVRTSTDAGADWTTQSIGSNSSSWTGSAISNDSGGSVMALSASGDSIYLSTDAGANWAVQSAPGTQTWSGVTESSDGTRIAAAAGSGVLYTYGPTAVAGGFVDRAHSMPMMPVLNLGTVGETSISVTGGANEQNGITNVGILYGVSGTSTSTLVHKDFTTNGPIQYSVALTGLTCGTQYQVTPYSTNSFGTTYGTTQNFTTLSCPVSISSGGAVSVAITPVLTPTATTTTSVAPAIPVAPTSIYLFTRDLHLGMTGADVQGLQHFLNTHGFFVSTTGPGSPGNETTYFGLATKAALAKYQANTGITPSAGYFGPLTRTYMASH